MEPAWQRQQKKAFTGFCNRHLVERRMLIQNLDEDLKDGKMLWNLLEIISGKQLPRIYDNPKMKFQKLANVDVSLRFLQQEKIPLVNISAVDIVDGKIGLTLGLVWTIILRYHIQKKGVPSAQKQDLIDWVNSMIAPLHISNLTKSFSDGTIFCALLNAIAPGEAIPQSKVASMTPVERMEAAFKIADEKLGIPSLLDPELVESNPDELSVMTYVSYFRKRGDEIDLTQAAEKKREEEEKLQREINERKRREREENKKRMKDEQEQRRREEEENRKREIGGVEISGLDQDWKEGNPRKIVIQAKNKNDEEMKEGGTPITVTLEDPDGHKQEIRATDHGNGSFSVEITPQKAGRYRLQVTSPQGSFTTSKDFHVAQSFDPSKCSVSLPDDPPMFGQESQFVIHTNQRSPKDIRVTARVVGPDGEDVKTSLKDNGDGSFTVSYTPTSNGSFKLEADVNGHPISSQSKHCTAEVSFAAFGFDGSMVQDEPFRFIVESRDPNGHLCYSPNTKVFVFVEDGSSSDTLFIRDTKNGQYIVQLTPHKAGNHKIHVQADGKDINGSPFVIKSKAPVDPEKSTADVPSVGSKGQRIEFPIVIRDALGDEYGTSDVVVEGEVLGPQSKVSITFTRKEDGTTTASFVPVEEGVHKVIVKANKRPIRGCPYTAVIRPATQQPVAFKCTATGPGLGSPVEETETFFVIQARDIDGKEIPQGGADFQVTIQGPQSLCPCRVIDRGNGTYEVQYTPMEAGLFKIDVSLGSEPIKGSRFIVVIKAVASPVNSNVTGAGLRNGVVGQESLFKIEPRDKRNKLIVDGSSKFEVIITNAAGEKEKVSILFNEKSDGMYHVSFVPRVPGTCSIEISVDGVPLNGSPFLPVIKSPSAKDIAEKVVVADQRKTTRLHQLQMEAGLDRRRHRGSLYMTTLYTAAYNGDVNTVRDEVKRGSDLNAQNEEGWTPLHACCDQGHLEVVKLLVENKVNLNVLNNAGASPLYLAVAQGRKRIAKLLINEGADVNLAKKGGWTPLHAACFNEFEGLTHLLVTKGASLYAVCDEMNQYTPLHIMVASKDKVPLHLVKLLVESGAPLDAQAKSGGTPLHLACFFGNFEVAEYLVKTAKAPLHIKNNKGRTPLGEAVFYGHQDIAEMISKVSHIDHLPHFDRVHEAKSQSLNHEDQKAPHPSKWRKAVKPQNQH